MCVSFKGIGGLPDDGSDDGGGSGKVAVWWFGCFVYFYNIFLFGFDSIDRFSNLYYRERLNSFCWWQGSENVVSYSTLPYFLICDVVSYGVVDVSDTIKRSTL